MRRRAGQLEAVTFNGWVGQGPKAGADNVEELLADTLEPHVLAGQEMHWLRTAPAGYRRLGARGREAGNNVLLVRRDVTVHDAGLLAFHHRPWVGPKHGRTHPPRISPWVELSLPGERRRWCVLNVHRITSTHGRNDPQRAAELAQLEAWLHAHRRRHPWRPSVALGDWNGRPATLAHRLGGDLVLVEGGPDGVLTLGAGRVKFRELHHRYGSDGHNPVEVTIARR